MPGSVLNDDRNTRMTEICHHLLCSYETGTVVAAKRGTKIMMTDSNDDNKSYHRLNV